MKREDRAPSALSADNNGFQIRHSDVTVCQPLSQAPRISARSLFNSCPRLGCHTGLAHLENKNASPTIVPELSSSAWTFRTDRWCLCPSSSSPRDAKMNRPFQFASPPGHICFFKHSSPQCKCENKLDEAWRPPWFSTPFETSCGTRSSAHITARDVIAGCDVARATVVRLCSLCV